MLWVRRVSLAGLACVVVWSMVTHWLGWRFGMGIWPVPGGTPWTYQLESGFVPALTVLSLLGTVISLYHLHNCHQDGCWRLGKHKVDGSPWCSRHHESARAAAAEPPVPAVQADPQMTKLIESIDGLAEAIRMALLTGRRP